MLSMKKNSVAATTTPVAVTVNPSDFDVIIGASSSIQGGICSGGSIRIDGKVTGDIQAEGEVIIGQSADCTGSIISRNIEISGKLTGDITSSGSLKIYSTGVLRGNIEVSSFIIDEGGVFEGLCHINTKGSLSADPQQSLHECDAETSEIT